VKYRIEITDRARADLLSIAAWIAAESSGNALRWLNEIERAIGGLDRLPERCPLALESVEFAGCELRQLVHGNYRILFIAHEKRVHVLHVRHAARQPADREVSEKTIEKESAAEKE
jgi:plasmid stabilization system protein ParE